MKIYLYNNWHNGDIITNRALVKRLMGVDGLEIALGSYRNLHYLVEDLDVEHIISNESENTPYSTSLHTLCPNGYISINTHGGLFPDIDKQYGHSWQNISNTFNRQAEIHGLGFKLSTEYVPMIDFESMPAKFNIENKKSIYIDNAPQRSDPSVIHFQIEEYAKLFPSFNFYFVSPIHAYADNLFDYSSLNLVELSNLSDICHAIIGKGSGPYLCTYTEHNRYKPRALCGFNLKKYPQVWPYKNNPIQYLYTHEEILTFLETIQ